MNIWFLVVTISFMLVSLAMVLIILVQRPSGGGLAGAFGGAGGSGSDTVFGGRVGDALTWATVTAFVLYLGFAIALNLLDEVQAAPATGSTPTAITAPAGGSTNLPAPGDNSNDTSENDDSGGLDNSDQSPDEVPIEENTGDSADDNADDNADDEVKPTTTADPPNSPGGDN